MRVRDLDTTCDPFGINTRYQRIRAFGYLIENRGPRPILYHGMKTWVCENHLQAVILAEEITLDSGVKL